jgi:hypothetical protein
MIIFAISIDPVEASTFGILSSPSYWMPTPLPEELVLASVRKPICSM